MDAKKKRAWWQDLLIKLAMIIAVALAAVLANCWRTGQLTGRNVSDGLFIAAAVAVLVGLLSYTGSWMARGRAAVQDARSAGDMNLARRTAAMMEDIYRAQSFLVVSFTAAILLILLSVLADWLIK